MIALKQIGIGQWAFLFGASGETRITDATLLPMGDWGVIFPTRDDAEWAASAQGLIVEADGTVTSEDLVAV